MKAQDFFMRQRPRWYRAPERDSLLTSLRKAPILIEGPLTLSQNLGHSFWRGAALHPDFQAELGQQVGGFPTPRCLGPPRGRVGSCGPELDHVSRQPGARFFSLAQKGRLEREISTLPLCSKIPHTRFVDLRCGTGPPWLRNSLPGFPFWESWVRLAVSS